MSGSLFEDLGGAPTVASIVEQMYARVMDDEELAPFFARTDMDRLRHMQLEFIASALGGPVQYSGAELQAVHAGRGIKPAHFSRFIGHLIQAMEDHGANKQQIDQMLGLVAMYRDRIVGGSNVDG